MAVNLIGPVAMNRVISHHAVTQASIHAHTDEIEARAKGELARANTSRPIPDLPPGEPYYIDSGYGDVDGFVNLNGPDAPALEFGHQPSGAFGPGGRFAHIKSKAPEGRYILSLAAGLI
jgi:hypothetical protein